MAPPKNAFARSQDSNIVCIPDAFIFYLPDEAVFCNGVYLTIPAYYQLPTYIVWQHSINLSSPDPGEAPSQSSEVADSQHELDKDGKKKRQRRQRTHFTSQQLQVAKVTGV